MYHIKKLISSCEPNPALCCLDSNLGTLGKTLFLLFLQIGDDLRVKLSVIASVESYPKGSPVTWIVLVHGTFEI